MCYQVHHHSSIMCVMCCNIVHVFGWFNALGSLRMNLIVFHYLSLYSSSSRSVRPHKSQEPSNDPSSESKRNYYDEQRYRSSDRDRDREREHRSRH